jgi:signal transduction histidine kinase
MRAGLPVSGQESPHFCGLGASAYCQYLGSLVRASSGHDATAVLYECLRIACAATGACEAVYTDDHHGTHYYSADSPHEAAFSSAFRSAIAKAPEVVGFHRFGSDQHLFTWAGIEPSDPTRLVLGFAGAVDHNDIVLGEFSTLLAIVVRRAATAAVMAQTSAQHRDESEFLKTILSVAEADYSNVYSTLLSACQHIVPSLHSIIWLVNQETKTLTLRSYLGGDTVHLSDTLAIENSLTGRAWLVNDIHYVQDIGAPENRPLFRSWPKAVELGLKSLVLVPIRRDRATTRDGIEAILSIFPAEPFVFERSRFEIISTEMGAALRVAHGYEFEALLKSLTDYAHKSHDLGSYSHRVATAIRDAIGAEGATLYIWDDFTRRLELSHSTGLVAAKKKAEVFIQAGEGITGRAFSEAKPRAVTRVSLADVPYAERTDHPFSTVVAVPIMGVESGHQQMVPIGVIQCANKRTYIRQNVDSFSPLDVNKLTYVATVIAPFIQLLQTERRRVSLLSRISHEILSPITSMRATAERIATKPGVSFEEVRALASDIVVHGTLVYMLSEGINLVNARTAGIHQYRKNRLDFIKEVVEPCIDMAKPLARTQSLRFDEIRSHAHGALWVTCDKTALQQVVFNLLTNGIKYHDRSNKDAFGISVIAAIVAKQLIVDVSDSGIGIAEDERDRIFDYGYRGRDTYKFDAKGIGVGLYIARSIVADLGGKLTLTHLSKPTTFTVALPIAQ